jgi:hypothetical protein
MVRDTDVVCNSGMESDVLTLIAVYGQRRHFFPREAVLPNADLVLSSIID